MHTLVIISNLFGNGAIGLWTFSTLLSLFESHGLELTDGEAEVELNGVEVASCETWLPTFFPDL